MKKISVPILVLVLLTQLLLPWGAAAADEVTPNCFPPPGPDITVTPNPVDFGSVLVGTTSPSQTVTIKDTGSYDIYISAVTITGNDPSSFNITNDNASGHTIYSNPYWHQSDYATVKVVFHPTSVGGKSANLHIKYSKDCHTDQYVDVPLTGTGIQPDIDVSPLALDFGNVYLGSTSSPQTVTVKNVGTANLTITGITINNARFTISSGNISGQTLAPSVQATITLTFTPQAVGGQSGNLTISSDDPDEGTVKVGLSGNGIAKPAAPDIAVSPEALDFGDVYVGSSKSLNVTISNVGDAGLTIYGVTTDNDKFSTTNITSLGAGESANVTVTFAPTDLGPQSGNLTISSDDPDEPAVKVTLSGNGIAKPAAPDIDVSPLALDFGNVYLGSTSSPQTVTVKNVGTANLTITGITINNARFSISSGNISGQTLAPSVQATITLTFTPQAVGAQSGNLTISSDDPDEGTVKVGLSGNGIAKPAAPDIAVSPEALDFGDVYVNSSKSLNVTISNVGDAGLTIYGVTTDNDKFSTTNITSLAAGESANVTVTFGPTNLGPQSGNLTISSDDPDEPAVKVTLSGNGIAKPAAPDIAVSPEALDFGDVYVNSSKSLNVTISNVGDAGLTIYGVTTDNDKFSTTNITSLGAGESANVTVTFAPDVVGAQSGNLTISSDDPDEPGVKVTLSGNGIAKPAAPDIAVSPEALDFGDVYVGSSKSLNVTISNVGDAGLTIYGITTDNDKFSTTNITSLAAGESANITVTFAPDAVGAQSGNLTISSDDPDEPAVKVTLSGNGIAKPAAPDIAVSPEALDFGDVYVGSSRSLNVTISNVGDAGLTIYGVTTDNDKFSTTNITSLAAGESANVTVTFGPTDLGPQSGNLTISSDDPDEPSVKVTLSGNGIAKPAAPDIAVSPEALDFGDVYVGATKSLNVTISNVGDAGLTIYGVTTDNDKFSTTNITSLGAGESANVTVTFAPTDLGPQSGNLTISSDDPDEGTVTVALSGNGIAKPAAPDIAVSPEALDFGDVYVGATKSLNVTISNVGDAGLTIYGVTTDNDKFSTTNITSLGAGESANVTVTFAPTGLGPQSGNLTISSDDPDEPAVKVTLSGNGIAKPAAPDIAVSPEALDFGDVYVGATRSLNVTISNVGDAGLTIYGVTTDNDKFSTTNITSLAAGESANVTVTFGPDAVGGQSGNLTISSDDPDEPAVKVTLSGNGITKPAAPDIAVSPEALDFGDVYVNSSKSLNVTIENVGDAGLTIYGITTDNDKFSTTNITSLGAGESANVTVTFGPTDLGPQSGNLTISSDDPDEPSVKVTLSGNGIAKPAAPDIAVSPEALDFGDVYVGSSKSLNVTISNVGDAGLTIYGITTDNDKFSTTNITSLAAGESANITVTFAPDAVGGQSGNLTISSDDPDEGTVTVALSGNGIAKPAAPDIAVSPEALDFGDVYVGSSRSLNVTISNVGDAGLTIYGVTTDNDKFSTTNITSLAAGESANVTVTFAPDVVGGQSGNLTISSDDPDEPAVKVTLTGNGIAKPAAPDIAVSPEALDFGDVYVNSSKSLNVTISNVGDAGLTIYGITTDNDKFSTTNITSLAAGESANVTVTFAPTDLGPQSGNLTISSDDPDEPAVKVTLSGNGIAKPAAPDIAVSPEALDFGDVYVGSTKSLNVTISNVGDAGLTIYGVTTDNDKFSTTNITSLAAGESANVTVTFAPDRPRPAVGQPDDQLRRPGRARRQSNALRQWHRQTGGAGHRRQPRGAGLRRRLRQLLEVPQCDHQQRR